jgi:hypothetical protein
LEIPGSFLFLIVFKQLQKHGFPLTAAVNICTVLMGHDLTYFIHRLALMLAIISDRLLPVPQGDSDEDDISRIPGSKALNEFSIESNIIYRTTYLMC